MGRRGQACGCLDREMIKGVTTYSDAFITFICPEELLTFVT